MESKATWNLWMCAYAFSRLMRRDPAPWEGARVEAGRRWLNVRATSGRTHNHSDFCIASIAGVVAVRAGSLNEFIAEIKCNGHSTFGELLLVCIKLFSPNVIDSSVVAFWREGLNNGWIS